jgi:hypothetical protein
MLRSPRVSLVTSNPGIQAQRTHNFNTVSKVKQVSLELESLVLVKLASISNTVLKLSFREKELRTTSTRLYRRRSDQ